MTDRATVTYLIDDTTDHMVITGPRVRVQMRKRCTVIRVTPATETRTLEVHLFKRAEHVHVERDID